MHPRKTVLTTGEVARICSVAPRTVSKWFDSGQLRGYRIPGSKDRRIPVEHLVRFMRAHGIPLDSLVSSSRRILLLDSDRELCDAIHTVLTGSGGYEVTMVATALEAGAATQELLPHVLVVDVTLPDVTPQGVVTFVRSFSNSQATCLVGVARGLTDGDGQMLLQTGFDGYLSKPFDARSLIRLVEELTSPDLAERST